MVMADVNGNNIRRRIQPTAGQAKATKVDKTRPYVHLFVARLPGLTSTVALRNQLKSHLRSRQKPYSPFYSQVTSSPHSTIPYRIATKSSTTGNQLTTLRTAMGSKPGSIRQYTPLDPGCMLVCMRSLHLWQVSQHSSPVAKP